MDTEKNSASNPAPPVLTNPSKKKIKPCFCYEMTHEAFYNCFSIVFMVFLAIGILNGLTILFTTSSSMFANLIINIVLLSFLAIGYHEYKKNGNYGSDMSYYFALTNYILAWVYLVFFVLVIVIFAIFGTAVFASLGLHLEGAIFGVILGTIVLFALPLILFNLYWNYCYFNVVREMRAFKEDEEARNDQISVEMKNDEANMTKELSPSETAVDPEKQ